MSDVVWIVWISCGCLAYLLAKVTGINKGKPESLFTFVCIFVCGGVSLLAVFARIFCRFYQILAKKNA